MPYRLYALSNAGSMFALLSYPVLFEPVFTTHQQAGMWSVGLRRVRRCCAAFTAFRVAATRPAAGAAGGRRADAAATKPRLRRQYADVAAAAGLRFGAAAGHHQSPLAERGGHPVSVGAAAEPLPAELHPVLRRQRLVPAQSRTCNCWPWRWAAWLTRVGVDTTGNVPIKVDGAAVLAWGCSPAAWCATASWRG